jgi:hypothetical protein
MTILLIQITCAILCALIQGWRFESKKSILGGFFIGLIGGPLGLILMLFIKEDWP